MINHGVGFGMCNLGFVEGLESNAYGGRLIKAVLHQAAQGEEKCLGREEMAI